MNKYEKMAEKLERKIIGNKGCVEITPNEAMEIYQYLLLMGQIQKLFESEQKEKTASNLYHCNCLHCGKDWWSYDPFPHRCPFCSGDLT